MDAGPSRMPKRPANNSADWETIKRIAVGVADKYGRKPISYTGKGKGKIGGISGPASSERQNTLLLLRGRVTRKEYKGLQLVGADKHINTDVHRQFSSTTGRQNLNEYITLGGNELYQFIDDKYDLANLQNRTVNVYMMNYRKQFQIMNMLTTAQEITIYSVRARQDRAQGKDTPIDCWDEGLGDLGNTVATGRATLSNTTPFMSNKFTDVYKVIQKRKRWLPAGDTLIHKYITKGVFKIPFYRLLEAGQTSAGLSKPAVLRGITVYTIIVCNGQIVWDDTNDVPTTATTNTFVVTTTECELKAMPSAASTLTIVNNLTEVAPTETKFIELDDVDVVAPDQP